MSLDQTVINKHQKFVWGKVLLMKILKKQKFALKCSIYGYLLIPGESLIINLTKLSKIKLRVGKLIKIRWWLLIIKFFDFRNMN